jgi:hypothetical protein
MGRDVNTLFAFNRGIVSPLALARQDLKRMALSAETQTNWMPRVLGAMMLRPGTTHLQSTRNNAAAAHLPFVFATDDTAIIELTDSAMRVALTGVAITRPSVATAVTNGAFATDVTGWTDSDEAGGTSAWAAGGYLSLLGNGTNYAIRDQQVTVAAPAQNVEHGLAIYVYRGVATLKVGSSSGGEQYITATTLRQGYHSIAFTPTGNFHIRLQANDTTATLVSSCTVEAAGAMSVTTPWLAADLQNVRFDQSGDVLFVACSGYRQRRIERQDTRSWSVVEYIPEDGPFRVENTGPITMTVAALSGSTTLTASQPYFRSTNVGSLFRCSSLGQTVSASVTAENQFSDPIRVTGIDAGRVFSIVITGTWVATVTLQRSVGEPGDWTDVTTYTTNQSTSYDDTLDNQIIYYRIGVKTGGYTSGTADCQLSYAAGSIQGVGIVTGYTSTTVVDINVLTAFGTTTATSDWWEGQWSDRRGWPSAVALFDGRLWWAGKDNENGSVSDAFDSFADTTEGDSGPIKRSIGSGPVDTVNWLMPLSHLMTGTQGAELVAKSSSLDEPLTPTAFSLKEASTLGSTNMPAVKIDTGGVYVNRSGSRVYELTLDGTVYNYTSSDLTAIVPEIGRPSFVRMAVQRQPDTRIHCVRSDGTVAILIFDRLEKVTCWVLYETDGLVEDVVVLPGTEEDEVYYCVNRTINGSTKRYLELWALESEAINEARSILTDSTYIWTGASSTTVTGLSHLEGEVVTVWANTKDLGTYTVTGGQITISEAATTAYVGLAYTARFKSAKLALGIATGQPLTQRQRLDHVGLVLANTHYQGLRFGQDFDHLYDLPLIEQGTTVTVDSVHAAYSEDSIPLDGKWDTDTRMCLEAASPRAATVLAAVIVGAGHVK